MNSEKCVDTLVIYPNTNSFNRFFGASLKREGVAVQGFYSTLAEKCMNLVRLLSMFNVGMPQFLTMGKWCKIKAKTIILFEEVGGKETIDMLECSNPHSRKIFYLWNTGTDKLKIKYAQERQWEIWSFDKIECAKYNYNLVTEFYPHNPVCETEIEYDVFFCGYDKGRAQQLDNLTKVFSQFGLKYRIIMREWSPKQFLDSKMKPWGRFVTFFETDYTKIVRLIQKSRCILELVKEGQVGYTMRTMESLFFERKLITNNKEILNADFYNKANHFVLGYNDINELGDWLSVPYNCTNSSFFQERYGVDSWYRQLGISNSQKRK